MRLFNDKAKIERPVITGENDLGEPIFGTPSAITTKEPVRLEVRARSMIYNVELMEQQKPGIQTTQTFTLYVKPSANIANNDIVTISSIVYVVKSVMSFSSHKEVALELC